MSGDRRSDTDALPIRHVARVVVLDTRGAVLLVRYEGEGRSYWVPPGGALAPGESHAAAAARELREETGLAPTLGPVLGERRFRLRIQGTLTDQVERYFAAHVPAAAPPVADSSGEDILEHRWWPLAALGKTAETIYPEGLAALLARALAERPRTP